eukprot:5215557-Amphidinium_carterae.1
MTVCVSDTEQHEEVTQVSESSPPGEDLKAETDSSSSSSPESEGEEGTHPPVHAQFAGAGSR